jgi:thioredoxin-like negative regulator of GroEL
MSQQQKKEIIVYIYSDFSPCCKQVQPKVIELSQKLQLYILNIDNKRIRRMILRCKKIKITKS